MQKVYRICYSTSQTDSKIHKEETMYNNYQGTFKERKKSVRQFDLLYTKPSYKIQKFQYCGPGKEMNTYLFDGIERPEKDTHI